jgi:hypothetical protein
LLASTDVCLSHCLQLLLRRQISALLRDPSSDPSAKGDGNGLDAFGPSPSLSLFGTGSPGGRGGPSALTLSPATRPSAKKESKEEDDAAAAAGGGGGRYSAADEKHVLRDVTASDFRFAPRDRMISNFSGSAEAAPSKEYRGIQQEIKDKESDDERLKQRLAALRELHRNGFKNLTSTLQDQKALSLSALERRINRRKRNGDDDDNGDGTAEDGKSDFGASTRGLLEAAAGAEGGGACGGAPPLDVDSFADIEEALVMGYKRRCVFETRAATASKGVLTEDILKDARREAADEIKRRCTIIIMILCHNKYICVCVAWEATICVFLFFCFMLSFSTTSAP